MNLGEELNKSGTELNKLVGELNKSGDGTSWSGVTLHRTKLQRSVRRTIQLIQYPNNALQVYPSNFVVL